MLQDSEVAFVGEAALHIGPQLMPLSSAMQEPSPCRVSLRPRRDLRYRAKDLRRANHYQDTDQGNSSGVGRCVGLGCVSLRAGLYTLAAYEARQRQVACLAGHSYTTTVQIVEVTDITLDGLYCVVMQSTGTGATCVTRCVPGFNPFFNECFRVEMQNATEMLQFHLVRVRDGRAVGKRYLTGSGEDSDDGVESSASGNEDGSSRSEHSQNQETFTQRRGCCYAQEEGETDVDRVVGAATLAIRGIPVTTPHTPSQYHSSRTVHSAWLTLSPLLSMPTSAFPSDAAADGGVLGSVEPKLLLRWRVEGASGATDRKGSTTPKVGVSSLPCASHSLSPGPPFFPDSGIRMPYASSLPGQPSASRTRGVEQRDMTTTGDSSCDRYDLPFTLHAQCEATGELFTFVGTAMSTGSDVIDYCLAINGGCVESGVNTCLAVLFDDDGRDDARAFMLPRHQPLSQYVRSGDRVLLKSDPSYLFSSHFNANGRDYQEPTSLRKTAVGFGRRLEHENMEEERGSSFLLSEPRPLTLRPCVQGQFAARLRFATPLSKSKLHRTQQPQTFPRYSLPWVTSTTRVQRVAASIMRRLAQRVSDTLEHRRFCTGASSPPSRGTASIASPSSSSDPLCIVSCVVTLCHASVFSPEAQEFTQELLRAADIGLTGFCRPVEVVLPHWSGVMPLCEVEGNCSDKSKKCNGSTQRRDTLTATAVVPAVEFFLQATPACLYTVLHAAGSSVNGSRCRWFPTSAATTATGTLSDLVVSLSPHLPYTVLAVLEEVKGYVPLLNSSRGFKVASTYAEAHECVEALVHHIPASDLEDNMGVHSGNATTKTLDSHVWLYADGIGESPDMEAFLEDLYTHADGVRYMDMRA